MKIEVIKAQKPELTFKTGAGKTVTNKLAFSNDILIPKIDRYTL